MTDILITIHEDKRTQHDCVINIPTSQAGSFIEDLQAFFEIELLQGEIEQHENKTTIRFVASKEKLENFRRVIITALSLSRNCLN